MNTAFHPERSSARQQLLLYFYCGLVFLVILVFAFIRYRLRAMPLERDEGEYAYAGQLILHGIPPYQLAYSMKLPGTAAAYSLFSHSWGRLLPRYMSVSSSSTLPRRCSFSSRIATVRLPRGSGSLRQLRPAFSKPVRAGPGGARKSLRRAARRRRNFAAPGGHGIQQDLAILLPAACCSALRLS